VNFANPLRGDCQVSVVTTQFCLRVTDVLGKPATLCDGYELVIQAVPHLDGSRNQSWMRGAERRPWPPRSN
jgi:hypothetical protein